MGIVLPCKQYHVRLSLVLAILQQPHLRSMTKENIALQNNAVRTLYLGEKDAHTPPDDCAHETIDVAVSYCLSTPASSNSILHGLLTDAKEKA